jgi:alpha-tubulin suppressor-like RCC1 family protein
VAEVSTGGPVTCARKTDGTVWCWGSNYHGQLGDGTTIDQHTPVQVTSLGTAVAEVSVGASTCVRKTDGTLWCWGLNNRGQLGDGTTIERHTPVQVSALGSDVREVTVGSYTGATCARTTDGALWCWGANDRGQLGDGTTIDQHMPAQVTALGSAVAQASASFFHTCARKTDGTLWCWGANDYGQLGDGTTVDQPTPVQVTSLGVAVANVSVGVYDTCARTTDGAAWCWGYNADGQLGDGTTLDRHLPVEVPGLLVSPTFVPTGGRGVLAAQVLLLLSIGLGVLISARGPSRDRGQARSPTR